MQTVWDVFADCMGCVQVNDEQTEWFRIPFGVKQGDILSPSLFSLFINDLALEIKHLNLRQFHCWHSSLC